MPLGAFCVADDLEDDKFQEISAKYRSSGSRLNVSVLNFSYAWKGRREWDRFEHPGAGRESGIFMRQCMRAASE